MTSITVNGLYKVFGKHPQAAVKALQSGTTRQELRKKGSTAAVIDATFEVQPGEIFVVMGLSGSGKSTLIRMLNGLLPATAGEVTIDGQTLTSMNESEIRALRREKISMVFQSFALLPHRTVGENAAYGLEIKGVNPSERKQKADEALRMVGLEGWGTSMPDELSGGMQQRVGLARALAADTEVLLMDEAFSALDPLIRKEMQDQLIDLQSSLGKTIVFITHDLNEAMRIGDHIAMMRDGRVEQVGTAEEILRDPANNYVASFVKDVDRSRVLTAESIAEQPPEVVGVSQGPLTAQKLMRESQSSWIVALNRDRTPAGILWQDDVAKAVRDGETALPLSHNDPTHIVESSRVIGDLFGLAADTEAPIVVVDENGKFAGVVPRVTLLSAASFDQKEVSK
ncbi:quaternary amine ABC transporter ATP-binding protein [Corynebacterium flavescens]|uniref:quaternary amine ABC transporter ATP-binding protein n=2 Tax=Corynebacterium flavescens TaxID=28028 RepID=UPI000EEE4EC3|nr:glycine betaine ABC transporter ATP-binding protein [Corynebacterium flavescens]